MSKLYFAYVIYPTYKIKTSEDTGQKKALVQLWCRLKNGRVALIEKPYTPYFFIQKKDEKKAKETIKDFELTFEKTALTGMDEIPLVKVLTAIPSDVPKIRDLLYKEQINCLEADIRFAYRAMMDWGIHSLCSFRGEQKILHNDLVYFENPTFENIKSYKPKLSILSFDIESDKYGGKIYCLSCYGKDENGKIKSIKLLNSAKKVQGAKNFPDEKGLLEGFCEVIEDWNPDIITGWNVIDFDLNLLHKRAKQLGVKLSFGRDKSEMKLRVESSFFRESKATITGRIVIDGLQALRNSFIKLDDYKLATAARAYSKDKKLIEATGKQKYQEIDRLYREDKEALLEYNLLDAKLVIDILENSGVLELTLQRSLLVGMPLDRVTASIASLDSLYLRKLRERGFVAPSSYPRKRDSEGVGGYVMKPKPGIYDYVIVCDFKSLYPSIMRTFNIDPLMYVGEEEQKKYEPGELILAPNGAAFKRELGIIPGILQNFWDQREIARKEGNELARYAIKIHMNSMYGVLASPNCRFFNRKIGNSITGFAHHFIKLVSETVRKQGYEVIYGDTDSLFIDLSIEDYDQAHLIGKKIQDDINLFIKNYVNENYDVKSFLELEFEKTFIRFVMPKVRGSDSGAKKRYAGLIKNKEGKEEISFTGLEMVRRDWTDLAKEFQYELYNKIFHKEEVAAFVRKTVKDLKAGKLDAKLIYKKQLRKDLDSYTKTTPPHVKAAMKLDRIDSKLIEYFITLDGPEPAQKLIHSIDYDHYITKQLKPIADSILSFYNTTFDEQIHGVKQKSLFEF